MHQHIVEIPEIDVRKVVGELRQHDDPVSLELAERQGDDLARGLVEVHAFRRAGPLAEERAQPGDDLGCPLAVDLPLAFTMGLNLSRPFNSLSSAAAMSTRK